MIIVNIFIFILLLLVHFEFESIHTTKNNKVKERLFTFESNVSIFRTILIIYFEHVKTEELWSQNSFVKRYT